MPPYWNYYTEVSKIVSFMTNKRSRKTSSFPISFVFAQLNTNAIDLERNWTKSAKLMNIFLILTGIPQKSCKRSVFIYTGKTEKRPLRFGPPLKGKCINKKKLNIKTSSMPYSKRTHQSLYLQIMLTGHKGVTNKGCRTRYLKSRGL